MKTADLQEHANECNLVKYCKSAAFTGALAHKRQIMKPEYQKFPLNDNNGPKRKQSQQTPVAVDAEDDTLYARLVHTHIHTNCVRDVLCCCLPVV